MGHRTDIGDPSQAPRDTDPFAGRALAQKYQLRGLEARRRTGLVYLADARGRAEAVSILIGHRELGEVALGGFTRESARLSGLRHPNLIDLLDHGIEHGHPYLVLERLCGQPLDVRIAERRRLSLEEMVPIAAQLLKAVGHLHSRKLVLRDLEPSDVMLIEHKGRADFVKLTDFGFGDLLAGGRATTKEHVVGIAGYLSPEAIKSDPLDARADVYSLGAIFYHMLAGRPPFEGDTSTAVFHRTLHDDPIELAKLVDPEVPPGLIELIHSCLAKKAAARPADADAIVESLIDVVPASLFRLRRAGDAGASATQSMIALRDSPRTPDGEAGVSMQAPSLTSTAEGSTPTAEVLDSAIATAPVRKRPTALTIAGIAAAVSLSAAVIVGVTHRGKEPPAPAAAPAPAAQAPAPQPTPIEPAVAKSAPITQVAPVPEENQPGAGQVKISSNPIANLYVDDQLLGTTPFAGDLPLGRHKVRLSSDGYQDWIGSIEVRDGGNLPVQVQLVQPPASKGARPSKRRGKSGGAPAPAAGPAAAPEDKGKDDGVFLPTGKKNGQ